MNLDSGPWESTRWWHEMRAGVTEYLELIDCTDPSFQACLPQLRLELHDPALDGDEAMTDEMIFKRLSDSVHTKVCVGSNPLSKKTCVLKNKIYVIASRKPPGRAVW